MTDSNRYDIAAPRASVAFLTAYAFAYIALWVALLTPMVITLALRVRQLAVEEAASRISLILGVGALIAMVAGPIFGELSDRTRSRFGRRRPWLVGGISAGFLSLAYIGAAQTIGGVLIGWCLAQLSFNAVLAALIAVLPDQVPAAQRGTVSGIIGMSIPVGQVGGTFIVQRLADNMLLAFVVPAAIGLLAILLFAYVLPTQPIATLYATTPPPTAGAPRSRFALLRHTDFVLVWVSRIFFVMGTALFNAYQPFFLLDELHVDAAAVPRLVFQSTLVQATLVVLFSLLGGRLSDATGRRRLFVFTGAAIYALGLWIIAGTTSYDGFLFAVAVTGIGYGVFVGVDLALVTEVLPDQYGHAAKDLGIVNITNTLPQVAAPAVAPMILTLTDGRYSLLFAVAGTVALCGSLFLLPMRKVR